MDNSLLAVRDINHKYIVVERGLKMNFEQLLKRAKNKDPEAKEQLYEMFRPLLIHQAMISGRFSEDLYQELSLTFLFCIDSFKIEKALRLIKDNENRQKKSKNKGMESF